MAMPLAIFLVMSSLVVEFNANTASALALERSIKKKKNGRASLKTKKTPIIVCCTIWLVFT